jgi:dienelactone hydrolase
MRYHLLPIFGLLALLGAAPAALAQPLPGTKLWDNPGDPAAAMVDGIHRYADRALAASVERRKRHWNYDFRSPEDFRKSVAPNRARFVEIIGAVGERVSPAELSYVSTPDSPAKVAENDRVEVFAVRWTVYPGVEADGLMLVPKGKILANVVAMADCDNTPEQFAGLAPGMEPNAQLARLLAEAGCRVLVPMLIDRSDEFSGNPKVRMTNLPHREWIYRMAYEAGRHIIGYEVDKVRAAVDWFRRDGEPKIPTGVVGIGEGGLIAFYAAAADLRIDASWIGGYFGPREKLWQEPIYRNVWGLLDEFGDAEIATLNPTRGLRIAPEGEPVINGPPPPRNGRADAASGSLKPMNRTEVKAEAERLATLLAPALKYPKSVINVNESNLRTVNEDDADRNDYLKRDLSLTIEVPEPGPANLTDARPHFDPRVRMKRQVQQLVDYTQRLIQTSEYRRNAYWSKADTSSPERWTFSIVPYRETFHEELIGKLPPASEPLEARTTKIFDEPKWTGYRVQIPVWPDVFASGILLLPKDLKEGERRPVVVCQHGLEARPDEVVNRRVKSSYNAFGAQLADRGYIVYAPQNPYIGKDRFRQLQRKLNPLRASLFSVIVRQHERTLEWLATLPSVDPERIAFYGLSYGGKTAMRVPAILKGYCLSICSADFNEWAVKCTNIDRPLSYLYTIEYDMYEFGLAERFNYAEMAGLIAPRPFMVERGHADGVAPDEWIGYEFAKVKRLYDTLGLADRVGIAYFNGPHMIRGEETFAFLERHLRWEGRDPKEK